MWLLSGCAMPAGTAVEALSSTCTDCAWTIEVDGEPAGYLKKFSGLAFENDIITTGAVTGSDVVDAWYAGARQPRTVELGLQGTDGIVSSIVRLHGAWPYAISTGGGEVSFEVERIEEPEPESFPCATCGAWSYTAMSPSAGQRTIIGGFKAMSGADSQTDVVYLYQVPDAGQLASLRAWRTRGASDPRMVELDRRDAAGASVERYRLTGAWPTDVRSITLADGTPALRTTLRVETMERSGS